MYCIRTLYILLQISIGFTTTKVTTKTYFQDQHPEVRPQLYEGDIELDVEVDPRRRVGIVIEQRLWLNKTVPYLISSNYKKKESKKILEAITTVNSMTCIKLVPRTKDESDYIYFECSNQRQGCSSYIGRKGGMQYVYLQEPNSRSSNCFKSTGTIIHEIMHSLGVLHEQSRWDRDDYITIHNENIVPGAEKNFKKSSQKFATSKYEYDIGSIMHYGGYYFTIDRQKPTITAKKPGNVKPGQRKGMSVLDCLKINQMYGCLDDPKENKRYYTICNNSGIK